LRRADKSGKNDAILSGVLPIPERRHTPGAEAPFVAQRERAKPEGLAYLDAKEKAKTTTKADPPPLVKDDNQKTTA
jgi:hypothetical protein